MAPRRKILCNQKRLSFNNEGCSPIVEGNADELEESVIETDLSDVLGKPWMVFRMSPLYNFQQSKLNVYGKRLSERLNAANYRTETTLRATLQMRTNLRFGENGYDGVLLEVATSNDQLVYTGYMLNCAPGETPVEDFTPLPIFLVHGKTIIVQNVTNILCKMFDCTIEVMPFSCSDLIIQLCMMLYTKYGREGSATGNISLQYRIPDCDPKDLITLHMSVEDTSAVINVYMEEFERTPTITDTELVETFYAGLMKHIRLSYQLDLNLARLDRIVLPHAVFTTEGKVKWTRPDIAETSLIMLQKSFTIQ